MNRDSTGGEDIACQHLCPIFSSTPMHTWCTDSDLREGLLVSDYDSDEQNIVTRPPQKSVRAVETNCGWNAQQSPHSFFFDCFLCWQIFLTALGNVIPESWLPAPSLTPLQLERLSKLEARVADKYDSENPAHVERLLKIWGHAFPSEPFPQDLKSGRWKDMGWQGEDPGTDVRGAGLLGLDCLIYLAEHHPSTYDRLLKKKNGKRAEWEYPFAVAALNVSFTLSEIINVKATFGSSHQTATEPSALRSAAGRGFVRLLNESDHAFEEVFVSSFEELDREWLRQGASYMQFGQVLKSLRFTLTEALSLRPNSIKSFRQAIER